MVIASDHKYFVSAYTAYLAFAIRFDQSKALLSFVVSPLVALMKDQVDSFSKRGVSAALVSSDYDAESEEMKTGVIEGRYLLVFISPEQLIGNKLMYALK